MDSLLLESSSYHNPVIDLKDELNAITVKSLTNDFKLTKSKLVKLKHMFTEEIRLGLMSDPTPRKSVFFMTNTFVTELEFNDLEDGDYLSMDLGGTNLRIILTKLRKHLSPEYFVKPYEIDVKYRRGKAENLFAFLADCIEDFLKSAPIIAVSGKRIPFGFTFSFGFDQLAIDKAVIKQFSLETDLPDAIGNDPVQYLRDAIDAKRLNIDVLAITNDTTAALALGRYMDPNAAIGMILGSGYNICYIEQLDRIERIADPIEVFGYPAKQVILNTECGFLGDDGATDFAKTQFDFDVDSQSLFPNDYTLEKVVGGVFMGEVVRSVLVKIAQSNALFAGKITEQLREKHFIKAKDVSAIDTIGSDDSVVVELFVRLGYQSSDISSDDINVVRYVCALVAVRNASVCASCLSSVIEHINKPMVSVAVDGTLYKKHPKLHQLITDFTQLLLPNHNEFKLFLADDGSGKGSALVAAVANKKQNSV